MLWFRLFGVDQFAIPTRPGTFIDEQILDFLLKDLPEALLTVFNHLAVEIISLRNIILLLNYNYVLISSRNFPCMFVDVLRQLELYLFNGLLRDIK